MDQEHTIGPALAACTEEERQEAMGRFVGAPATPQRRVSL